ncbi:MAG: S41 family peptidase, partial [Pseudomonadota bacterium]
SFASRPVLACLLAALAAPAGAQILDDTRGLGARGEAARRGEIDQLRKVSEVFARVKSDFVDAIEEPVLAGRCTAAMDRWLGENGLAAAIPPPAPSADRSAERIARYWKRLAELARGEADFEKLADACLHGMVDRLDRRTEYLDREKFRDLAAGARGTAGSGVEPPVKSRLLEGGVLYLRLSQFSERALEDFYEALRGAAARLAGIVLDLRGNPGGLFHSCIGVSAAFLPETALVVETKGRARDSTARYSARAQDYRRSGYGRPVFELREDLRAAPLVVLVNRRSAACSEIVAAAMQDHKRAKVVGEKTFGLGTVQTVIPLGGSEALRLTTARFYRPSGEPIEEKAVTPDVQVEHPERFRGYGEPQDPGLPAALKALGGR